MTDGSPALLTEADLIGLFRRFVAVLRGQPAPSPAPQLSTDAIGAVRELLQTLITEVRIMSDAQASTAQQITVQLNGLKADLVAAQARSQTHEAAKDALLKSQTEQLALNTAATQVLNAELDRLRNLPVDTSANEAALTGVLAQLAEARSLAQNIEADPAIAASTAASTGSSSTTGAGSAGTITGTAGAGTSTLQPADAEGTALAAG